MFNFTYNLFGGKKSPAGFRAAAATILIIIFLEPSAVTLHGPYASGLRPPGSGAFHEMSLGNLAPDQPYSAFFGECPALVHRRGITFTVYAVPGYDIYMRTYNHKTGKLSLPEYVALGWNDHIRPALLIDEKEFLHVFYGARPRPIRYIRSTSPLNWLGWSCNAIEKIGSSGTYPVPVILDDRIFLMYREGDSFGASLSFAARDMNDPIGQSSAWTIEKIVERSGTFISMPLAAFKMNGSACFLFNMRDALLSYPHAAVSPSVREALSVICTKDGSTFTDITGNPVEIPLNYARDRSGFPVVLKEREYIRTPSYTEKEKTCDLGGLIHDGAFVELSILKESRSGTTVLIGGGTAGCCALVFTPEGRIQASNGPGFDTVGYYEPRETLGIRLKFYFSTSLYRMWINDGLAGDPRQLTNPGPELPVQTALDSLRLSSEEPVTFRVRTGREYKLITASACVDSRGTTNFFFIDRKDSSTGSHWALMHQRKGEVREIGDESFNKYHPSSISAGDNLYVATAYFEGEGLFLNNEHLCPGSRIYLLRSADYVHWDETRLGSGDGGQVHPVFKRPDNSGLLELLWTGIEDTPAARLRYGYCGIADTVPPDTAGAPDFIRNFPNPSFSTTTILLKLASGSIVTLEIYDVNGRLIKRLLDGERIAGETFEITWEGDDERGDRVSPGVYFSRLRTQNLDRTRKIVLLR